MIKRHFFQLLLGLMFITLNSKGISQDSIALKKTIEIETYLYQDPLTAKSALLELLRENKESADSTRGLIYLKIGTALGMTNKLDSGLWSTRQALQLLPQEAVEYAGAMKLMAILYRLKGDYPNAEAAIMRTLDLSDSLWKDPFQKVLTIQEYASLCLDLKDYFKATTLYLDALNIASKQDFKDPKGSYTLIRLRINLAEAYLDSRNYPFAIREFSAALPQLDSVKDNEGYLRTGIALCLAYLGQHQLNDCDSLLVKLQTVADKVQNEELQSYLWVRKGMLAVARKNSRAALPYYRKAFDAMRSNNSSMLISECVNNYLAALNSTTDRMEALQIINDKIVKAAVEDALPADRLDYMRQSIRFILDDMSAAESHAFLKELMLLSDSVNAENLSRSTAELQAKYQFDRQAESERLLMKENDLLKQKAEYKRNQLYLFIAIVGMAFIILAMSIRRLRQRALLQSNELKAKEQEIRFQKDRSEWMEREKSFRDQLINQQKVVMTQAIADKDEITRMLKELVTENQEQRRLELMEQLEKSKDKKLNIEVLLSQFNAVYPTFAGKLFKAYPKLSQSDVQFCTLVRMNLNTKEISALLSIDPKSVYVKKYRTMEKMGLAEGDDFEKIVLGIG